MKLILLGDLAFTGIFNSQEELNFNRFSSILPLLSQADLVFANLEVPIKINDIQNEYKKKIFYSLASPMNALLKLLNIGCVSLANNHIYDFKMPGLRATINMLDNLGIYHTGAGWLPKHIEPVIIEKSGVKIAFLACVDQSTNPKTENYPELFINYLDPDKILKTIKECRLFADRIILSIHWGMDYSYYPTSKQIQIAHTFVDAGVDLILGHHPHTLQPYEKYNERNIFYSLGTFAFGDIQRGNRLFSLPIKTKKSIIIHFNTVNHNISYQGLNIEPFGFMNTISFDYEKWSVHKMNLANLKSRWIVLEYIIGLKESFLDRINDFFFGYYKNPLHSLLNENLKVKIKNSIRHFRTITLERDHGKKYRE